MKHASNYKTEYGLYRATMRAIDKGGFPRVWFCQQALFHCKNTFPELLPMLELLIFGGDKTLDDLSKTS